MTHTRKHLETLLPKDIVTVIDSFFFTPANDHWGQRVARFGYFEDCTKITNPNAGLYGACKSRSLEIARLMIQQIETKEGPDWDECLRAAIAGGELRIIDLVYAHSSAINWKSVLFGACEAGSWTWINTAAANGAEFCPRALYFACRGGQRNIAACIIASGMPPSRGMDGACKSGHLWMMKWLATLGADPRESLGPAIRFKHLAIVRWIMLTSDIWPAVGDICFSTVEIADLIYRAGRLDVDSYLLAACMYGKSSHVTHAAKLGATNLDNGLSIARLKQHDAIMDLITGLQR